MILLLSLKFKAMSVRFFLSVGKIVAEWVDI